MIKTKSNAIPAWVNNLRVLMEKLGLNPRSLSLKAGLNSTAVRDMFEGRSRFPRYDTVKALADALGTTPAVLMSDDEQQAEIQTKGPEYTHDLDLLTEIISRLQETTEELGRKLEPRDFAAMASTIYHRLQMTDEHKKKNKLIGSQIHDLLDYELIRQKRLKR